MKLSMSDLLKKLRKYNQRNYLQFVFCMTFSVLLITSYAVMLYSTLVQQTLPVGGDSRKQVMMIFAIALAGCLIFIVYSAGLFLKYKSRETGVFLALGTKKNYLAKKLMIELLQLMLVCIVSGVLLGIGLAFLIWRIFQLVLSNLGDMTLGLSFTGVTIGAAFGLVSMILVLFQLYRFVRRTDMMEILYHQQTSEPLRPVTTKYGVSGVVLLAAGVLLGFVGRTVVGYIGFQLPAIWNLTYLLSLVGIYRIMTYTIMKNKRGRNPQQYYNHLIAANMMKFQGRQTVRNMSIVALLLAASIFASFYPPQLANSRQSVLESPADYTLHYQLSEDEVDQAAIYQLAKKHDVKIKGYQEIIFSELVISGVERDWTDDGKLKEEYIPDYRLADFIDATTFNQEMKQKLVVPEGTYYKIKGKEATESFFEKDSDMDQVTNPVTKQKTALKFAGTIASQQLINNGNSRYILNDHDYHKITSQLNAKHQIKQILFNVADAEASYPFAQELYQAFLSKASPKMAVQKNYDAYQESKALTENQRYDYGEKMKLTVENHDLMEYWKYYPMMKILVQNTFFQTTAVYFLVFIYVAIICLAAVGVISYTRSITIGLTNQQLFEDLKRLGANNRYIRKCVINQLNKLFVVPTLVAALMIYAFTLLIFGVNDGQITSNETRALMMDSALLGLIFVYQLIIYSVSFRKIKGILNI
ncbi:ABC transporter permease [Enterococcus hulanensis]|uniref:ABC transporter permease n=1 Tax=Enterococcus hulanensis TaxID=2559929 RepID=A0ABU3F149_9ENTE|nr:ABC transporter permease [Enterococcus hulanensis]MDT2600859.1 ABC transporter permease [Enterococcus hulanensis]MDT2611920.1 ABC transporter permease [Enterococcus hulanensis]MDT2618068.1 ABC transporter permease [Enterococcus hulanensis]MDT2629071.1 ABC transporter permease [Enterococcus hulanensis]MDT2656633.1 ABC transporter permease [Enterococcus hulanensis]